ncbi:hypothetical protein JCM18918_4211 [Cutibacterium acnes JCM 18918]|nr:hypothetical protein JCM18918_4211 [Cutibacterium acnes JCM 18918]
MALAGDFFAVTAPVTVTSPMVTIPPTDLDARLKPAPAAALAPTRRCRWVAAFFCPKGEIPPTMYPWRALLPLGQP